MSWRASAYIKAMQDCPNGEPIAWREKYIALILADSHQDKMDAYTFPSVDTIAGDARMDRRTCQRLLDALERKGVIAREYPERQGRGQVTFYSFPELDKSDKMAAKIKGKGRHGDALSASAKGRQTAALFLRQRAAKGRQKGGNAHAVIGTVTGTQKQKTPPHVPPAHAGGSSTRESPGLQAGLFDGQACAAAPGAGDDASIAAAIEQTMSGCTWTKRRLRQKLRAVFRLELDKGTPAATTALAIMAAWKFQRENSHLLRGKFGPANFLELGIWKDANLLQWDHARMDADRARRGAFA